MPEPEGTISLAAFGRWAAQITGFSPEARRLAALAIADTLGCMMAGRDDPAVTALRTGLGYDPASEGRASPSMSALVNGTAAHALDFDDNFRPGRCHASAVLVPALLALAAEGNASGSNLIDAYIIGLEGQAFVGRTLGNGHNLAGWHPTGTVAAIGAAAGAARLLRLPAGGIAAAMSNATSMAAGLKVQFGTAMKPIHAGLAARAAVEAALMATSGISGNPAALDHPAGFSALYGGAQGGNSIQPVGRPLAIESDGVVPKLYPCCGSTHYVLDMIYALRRVHGFSADHVLSVMATVGPANYDNLPFNDPQDAKQARFSMPYCVALALTQERLALADFTDAAVARPEVRKYLPLTKMHRGSGMAPEHSHSVVIKLADGRELQDQCREVKGSLRQPFDLTETTGKFVSCLTHAGISATAAEALYRRLLALDDIPAPVSHFFAASFFKAPVPPKE